ncbi:hypothetical protein B296_00021304 [Ensete ventricosum]|uniref:Uncharacterized protein n=1 Tax=Ensete ventricosum TaxID=4639 RepID=A0A426XXM6_ENSVE|nr:hypothetical protein B296_00021304 [Ensete ventricosum]
MRALHRLGLLGLEFGLQQRGVRGLQLSSLAEVFAGLADCVGTFGIGLVKAPSGLTTASLNFGFNFSFVGTRTFGFPLLFTADITVKVNHHQVFTAIPRGHPPPPSRTSSASFALKVTLSSSVQIYLFLLSNDSLSSTSKLEISSASAFSSSVGPRWLSQFIYRGVLLHEAIFLVHHHCRISSNKQRHLPYPICSRQWLLHLLAGAIHPAASIALFSLSRVPVRAIAYCLSVLYREGATSSFSLSNDSKSTTVVLLSLPFISIDRPSHSSISSVEVNRRQTFTEVDNTAVSLTSGQDLRPSQELDLVGA